MSRTQFKHSAEDLKTENSEDLAAVRNALAKRGLDGKDVREHDAVLVPDVAEATGLSPDDVARHLDRIRMESAWNSPAGSRQNLLVVAAVATLCIGLAAVWVRGRSMEASKPGSVHDLLPPQRSVTTVIQRPMVQSRPMVGHMDGRMANMTPPGISLHVVASGVYFESQGQYTGRPAKAIPYDQEVSSICAAVAALVQGGESERNIGAAVGELVRDNAGSNFRIQAGKTHVTIEGWAGTSEFWIGESMDATAKADLKEEVEKYLAEPKTEQDSALSTDVDPTSGIVLPPPGVQIEFAGRRLDIQNGPRLAFADVDPTKIAKRIELAIRNAFERDHRPPTGQWTVSEAVDRKTPIPIESRVKIIRNGETTVVDLPTTKHWTSEDERIIATVAEKSASKIVQELSENGQNPIKP